jgi:glycosyltransferase involved in cell wall biosynthesis
MRRVLAEFRPDVVHVGLFLTELSPSFLPLLRDIPSLLHAHWYRTVCPLGTKRLPNGNACEQPWGVACLRNRCLSARAWAPLMIQRELWRRRRPVFDRIVACGSAVRCRLEEAGIGPVEVVWNGVPVRSARLPLQGAPTIGFSGRFVPEKGVDLLVEAFALVAEQLPDARLLLCGDGPQRVDIARRIRELRLDAQVELTGWLPRAAVEKTLDSAWVEVVPSRWDEPFGLAVAEAMMRGTAVVASDAGGPAELICHEQTGLLVPPNDHAALARGLTSLLRDRATAERLGAQGRRFALSNLTEDMFVDRMLGIYEEMIH